MTSPWLVAGVALGAAVVVTPVAMALARRTGVVDRPGELKPQDVAVPYLGGVAVFVAVIVGAVVGRPLVIAPIGAALVLGSIDDAIGLSPLLRLGGQVCIGAGVAAVMSTRLPGVGSAVAVGAVTVLLMNGVNFIDGLDGLASGVGFVGAVAFAILLRGDGRDFAIALGAALAGFLLYNRPPARVYLGDGGAYVLGTSLATLLVWTWSGRVALGTSVASLLLIAVPSAEVAFAVVRRARARLSVSHGDRRHPYDLLVAAGRSRTIAAGTYIAVEVVLAGIALAVKETHGLVGPLIAVIGATAGLVAAAAVSGALGPGAEVIA